MEKICCRCNVSKPTTMFYKCNKAKDKLQSSCKDCKRDFGRKLNNNVAVEYKKCKHCEIVKPSSEFRTNKQSSDGLRHECKDCRASSDRQYRLDNWDAIYPKKREYEINNRKELNKKRVELYHSNLDKYRSRSLFYVHARRKSQPKWTMEFKAEWNVLNNSRIELENTTGIKHNIDHIIPVIHPDVCGLSVPWNYQILTQEENVRKSNQFDGTYDNESWRS